MPLAMFSDDRTRLRHLHHIGNTRRQYFQQVRKRNGPMALENAFRGWLKVLHKDAPKRLTLEIQPEEVIWKIR